MRWLAIAGAVAAVLVLVPFASRAEDANRACDGTEGVTLVVDFQSLGGGVNVRCAVGSVSNGYDVFHKTGVDYETVSGRDFICRIAAKPADADCSTYPPGNYYWSYWWAKPGGDWQYGTKGAGAHKPSPGAYEGWSFVNSDQSAPPRYPPPPAPTTTTAAAGTPTTAAKRVTATTRVTPQAGTAAPETHAVTTTTTSPEMPTSTSVTTTSIALGHVDLSQTSKGNGTSLGFIASALAVTVLAAMAIAVARTR